MGLYLGIGLKMKKTITLLVAFGLIMSLLGISVIAQGAPMPAPIKFMFYYDGQPIQNYQITFRIGAEEIKRITNEQGGIALDVSSYSPDFKEDFDVRYAVLNVDCGFTVCNKEYSIWEIQSSPPQTIKFSLAEQPPVTCPTCSSCSPCNCGGGGGVVIQCTKAECDKKYPCFDCVCEACPECKTDIKDVCNEIDDICYSELMSFCDAYKYELCEDCKDTVCPECPKCDICDECPEQGGEGVLVLSILISLIAGGAGGVYFTKNSVLGIRGGVKIYRNNKNQEVIKHKHPGILGYHEPNTEHRDTNERHPKGQLRPQYEKNSDGDWVYIR